MNFQPLRFLLFASALLTSALPLAVSASAQDRPLGDTVTSRHAMPALPPIEPRSARAYHSVIRRCGKRASAAILNSGERVEVDHRRFHADGAAEGSLDVVVNTIDAHGRSFGPLSSSQSAVRPSLPAIDVINSWCSASKLAPALKGRRISCI